MDLLERAPVLGELEGVLATFQQASSQLNPLDS